MVFLELRRDSRVTTGNSGCLLQICGQYVTLINVREFTVNFPMAFTSVWSVTITNAGHNADTNAYGKIDGVGTSSFDIYTNLSTSGWYWMAIGTWK